MYQSLFCLSLIAVCLFGSPGVGARQNQDRLPNVAVLDFGDSSVGRSVADRFVERLKSIGGVRPVDRDASRIAGRGAGYKGSLNLSLREARDLGEAIGCDFYFIGDAQTLRRSASTRPVYFESYASIFLVSSRTGKLVMWRRPSFEADDAKTAEQSLLESLSGGLSLSFLQAIQTTYSEEKQQRLLSTEDTIPVIEEAPEDEKAAKAIGLKLPKPYHRLRPAYPASAAQADAEAVVDVLVDLDAAGEVNHIDIARWAGFGLDEATIETVRQLHFFPASRNGTAVPIRVLLRYNFRKTAK